jgi:hypothetical protein
MKDLAYYAALDDLILAETNVKTVERPIMDTERGKLTLVYDGEYRFMLDEEDVTTPRLLAEVAPGILEKSFNRTP